MSALTPISAHAIETVLSLIVPFLLPALRDDLQAARRTAWEMLSDHRPRSCEELLLAGEIVHFSLQGLKALADAAEPGLAFAKLCRHRGAAVSLQRAGGVAQRRLEALRKAQPAWREDGATGADVPDMSLQDLAPVDVALAPPIGAPLAAQRGVEQAPTWPPVPEPTVSDAATADSEPTGPALMDAASPDPARAEPPFADPAPTGLVRTEAAPADAAPSGPAPVVAPRTGPDQAEPPALPVAPSAAPAAVAANAQMLLRAAHVAVRANNPTHARQLAEAARKASLAQRMSETAKRRQAEYRQREAASAAAGT